MSNQGGGGEERTEKATPKKLKKARREGQISNTPEMGAWLGMLIATLILPKVFGSLIEAGTIAMVGVGAVIRNPDLGVAYGVLADAARAGLWAVIPMAALIAVIGVVGVALQGGIWVAPKLLKPQAKRLNPLSGFKRMFGPQGAWQGLKALLKSLALGLIVILSVKNLIPTVYGSGSLTLSTLISIGIDTALTVLRLAAVGGLVLAIADIAVVRKRNNKQLKMTKYEIKQEHKQSEGDPHFKHARRSRALAMSRNRMMRDVPNADVVLVNPTHVAVALQYETGRGAPRVLAKGADHVAARIRGIADEHRIPMVRDIPLARTLYGTVDIGAEIPPDLYQGVAMVLAFVMTLKAKGSAAGMHRSPNPGASEPPDEADDDRAGRAAGAARAEAGGAAIAAHGGPATASS